MLDVRIGNGVDTGRHIPHYRPYVLYPETGLSRVKIIEYSKSVNLWKEERKGRKERKEEREFSYVHTTLTKWAKLVNKF